MLGLPKLIASGPYASCCLVLHSSPHHRALSSNHSSRLVSLSQKLHSPPSTLEVPTWKTKAEVVALSSQNNPLGSRISEVGQALWAGGKVRMEGACMLLLTLGYQLYLSDEDDAVERKVCLTQLPLCSDSSCSKARLPM